MRQALLVTRDGTPLLEIHGTDAFNPAMAGGADNHVLPCWDDLLLDFPRGSDWRRVIFNEFNHLACPDCRVPMVSSGDVFIPYRSQKHSTSCTASISDNRASPELRLERAIERRQPVVLDLNMPSLPSGITYKRQPKLKPQSGEMVIPVHSADEFARLRAQLLATPGRYCGHKERIKADIGFMGRQWGMREHIIDSRDVTHIRRLLLDIMGRTTKTPKKDGRQQDAFHPYWLLLFAGNGLPLMEANHLVETDLLKVRDQSYFKTLPLCRYGLPFHHARFEVTSDDASVRKIVREFARQGEPLRVLATLNETELRHHILTHQYRHASNGHLSIPVVIHDVAQIAAGASIKDLKPL